MATLIICPNCQTRYEIAAALPPEGRKVRCSKCSHVWQATAAAGSAAPMPPREAPPREAAPPQPQPRSPMPPSWPQAPGAQPAQPPRPSQAGPGAYGQPSGYGTGPQFSPPANRQDASFDGPDDFQADAGRAAGADQYAQGQEWGQEYGSYTSDANYGAEERPSAISLAGRLAKVPPPVAIGWGALTLFLVLLFAFVALAPSTVVSILPGASRLYSGSPSLDLQDVQFSWDATNIESPVMMVEGQIVNQTSDEISPPPVLVALIGPEGQQVSAFATEIAPIAGGASAPFTISIPAPPQPVASLEVRFQKAS